LLQVCVISLLTVPNRDTLIQLYFNVFSQRLTMGCNGVGYRAQRRKVKAIASNRLFTFEFKSCLQNILPCFTTTNKELLFPIILYKRIVIGFLASPQQQTVFSLARIVYR